MKKEFLHNFLSSGSLFATKSAKTRKTVHWLALFFLFLLTDNAHAALFSQLTQSGSDIFMGMRDIIYAVAGFGIVGIAIGAFFGNLNWKWLSAIIIGLMVIAGTAGILMYMTDTQDLSSMSITITDSLINAAPLPNTKG